MKDYSLGKVVRAAEGAGLENQCAVTPYQEFESLTFRAVQSEHKVGPVGPIERLARPALLRGQVALRAATPKAGRPSTCSAEIEYAPRMRGPLPRAFTGISICSFLRKRKERPHRSDWGRFAVMSKSDKQSLRYSDYYWC